MKRPRIALWIKRLGTRTEPCNPLPGVIGTVSHSSPPLWMPGRLWNWALWRVDRWHLLTATLPQWTAFDETAPDLTPERLEELIRLAKNRSDGSTTLLGKLHK